MNKDTVLLTPLPLAWDFVPVDVLLLHGDAWLSGYSEAGQKKAFSPDNLDDVKLYLESLESSIRHRQDGNRLLGQYEEFIVSSMLSIMGMLAEIEAVYSLCGVKVAYVPLLPKSADSYPFLADLAFSINQRMLLLNTNHVYLHKQKEEIIDNFKVAADEHSQIMKCVWITDLVSNKLPDNFLLEGGDFVYDPFNDRILLGISQNKHLSEAQTKDLCYILSDYLKCDVLPIYYTVSSGEEELMKILSFSPFQIAGLDSLAAMANPSKFSPGHLDQCLAVTDETHVFVSRYVDSVGITALENAGYCVHVINDEIPINALNIAHVDQNISIGTHQIPEITAHYQSCGKYFHCLPFNLDPLKGGVHCLANRVGFQDFFSAREFNLQDFPGMILAEKEKFLKVRLQHAASSLDRPKNNPTNSWRRDLPFS